MERLKKENIKKREEREAELLKQADQLSQAAEAVRQAARNGNHNYIPTGNTACYNRTQSQVQSLTIANSIVLILT